VLVTPFTTFLLPLVTTLYEKGQRIAGTVIRICAYFLLLAAVPTLLFLLWPEWIMVRLYGDEFAGGAPVLLPLTGARLLGHLCHMLALVYASTNRFRFLAVYTVGLAVQALALIVWGTSPTMVAGAMLVTQAITLSAMLGMMVCHRRRKARSQRSTIGD
jgi:O-antigen/teichoic acid export membrane protein